MAHRATPMASADSGAADQCPRVGAAQVGEHPVVVDLHGVGPHVGDRPHVDTVDRFDLQIFRVEDDPQLTGLDGHRQHQHRRLRGGRHGARLAADHQCVAMAGGGQPGVDGVGGDGGTRCQVGQQRGVGSWAEIRALAMADGADGPGTAP